MRHAADSIPTLPKDAAALRALLLATLAERDSATAERENATRSSLIEMLLLPNGTGWRPSATSWPPATSVCITCCQLGLDDLEASVAESEAQAEKCDPELRRDKVAKRRAGRGALPAHLPRIEVTLSPEDTECPCCRKAMVVIGTDSSERLDVVSAQFRVLVMHRPKLACRTCDGVVVQTPASPRLIEGGVPTEALVAHVLVSRYADHLPLYRQAQILARQGVLLDRATLAFWVGYAAAEVAPVVARLRETVLSTVCCRRYAKLARSLRRPTRR